MRTPFGMARLPNAYGAREASYRNTKKRTSSLQQLQKALGTPGPGERFWETPSQGTCACVSVGETLPKGKMPPESGLLLLRPCSLYPASGRIRNAAGEHHSASPRVSLRPTISRATPVKTHFLLPAGSAVQPSNSSLLVPNVVPGE